MKQEKIGLNPSEEDLEEALDKIREIRNVRKKLNALKLFVKIVYDFYNEQALSMQLAKYFFILARIEASQHSQKFKLNPY